jgi:hypothetical protein
MTRTARSEQFRFQPFHQLLPQVHSLGTSPSCRPGDSGLRFASVLSDALTPLRPLVQIQGVHPPRRQGYPPAVGAAPPHLPRSQSLACADMAPPHRPSLTPLPPFHFGLSPPFRRKTLFAFRVRGIDFKITIPIQNIPNRCARSGIAATIIQPEFRALDTPVARLHYPIRHSRDRRTWRTAAWPIEARSSGRLTSLATKRHSASHEA